MGTYFRFRLSSGCFLDGLFEILFGVLLSIGNRHISLGDYLVIIADAFDTVELIRICPTKKNVPEL